MPTKKIKLDLMLIAFENRYHNHNAISNTHSNYIIEMNKTGISQIPKIELIKCCIKLERPVRQRLRSRPSREFVLRSKRRRRPVPSR
jgi:hypothetical protein